MGKRRQRRQLAIIGLLAAEVEPLPAYVISTKLYHLRSAFPDLFQMEREGRVVGIWFGPSIAPELRYSLPERQP